MLRMFPLPRLVLLACLPLACTACKTPYTDIYRPKHNYFVADPPKKDTSAQEKKALEQAVAAAALANPTPPPAAGTGIPGLDQSAPPVAPEMGAAPAGGAAPVAPPAPVVPGL